jgi:hypothetical protein
VSERSDPRASFAGHTLETPWDPLQRSYFNGYAAVDVPHDPVPAGAGDYVESAGLRFPARRRAYMRGPDLEALRDREMVSIDLRDVRLS